MKRGQMAIEFLGTLGVAALIFIIFSVLILQQFSFMYPTAYKSDKAQVMAQQIATEINYAYANGDGYRANFELPEMVGGGNYTVYHNSTNKVIEVDVIEDVEDDIDNYGVAHYVAGDVRIVALNLTNVVSNSKGYITVRGAP